MRILLPSFAALRAFLLALALLVAGPLLADPQSPPSPLEGPRAEITQIEAALTRADLDDVRLNELRARLEPLGEQIGEVIGREQPRAEEIKARIVALGPPPDAAKGITEGDDVKRERAEQDRLFKEAEDAVKLAQSLATRVTLARETISERRRQNFSRAILKQTASIASPLLWISAAKAMPGEAHAARTLLGQWGETILANLSLVEGLVLALLVVGAVLGWPYLKVWVRTGAFSADLAAANTEADPTRFTRALIALRHVALNALVPAGVLFLLEWLIDSFGLMPERARTVMDSLVSGLVFIVGMSGLVAGLLAPRRANVRLFAVPDGMAHAVWSLVRTLTSVIAVGHVLEAFQSAIVSALPVTVVTKGAFAVVVGLLLARGLRRIFAGQEDNEIARDAVASLLPARLFGWVAVVGILGAALTGYVSLAAFLVNQVVWLTILGMAMLLLIVLIEELLGRGVSSTGGFGRRVREATGLKASSLDQIAVLGSGFARLVLFVALGMLALAPWGIDSSNLIGNLKAAFFGFTVGGVTISLSTIAMAILFFVLGLTATRAVQNWLESRYLPHTSLDPGLRNSISTIFGYIGTIAAAMVALTQIGLSMEKLTLVAGALSVGIGFGLKSIVENFVSGLILLWERPIRVGDTIAVGAEQGKVKRINVRSTEIETGDRASLIIPNAEFISGRVKNWTHADRMGRIIIPLIVETNNDPAEVQELLRAAALANREVMSDPPPNVIFKNLSEDGLEFELRAYVDVDALTTTRSELLFDIFARLRAARIEVPTPTRRLEITNLSNMVEQGVFVPSATKLDGSQ